MFRKKVISKVLSLSSLVCLLALTASLPVEASSTHNKRDDTMHNDSGRYERGLKMLDRVDGRGGMQVVDSLQNISPDFARYLIEYPFGDIYSRPGLDLKSREIAVVAALTALGNAKPQLKVHIAAAMNVGCTQEEIIEVIMQMSVYAGFPAALNALFAASEVIEEHKSTGNR